MIITVISNKIFLIVNFSRNMTRVDQKVSANWDIISLVAQTFATDSQKRINQDSCPNWRKNGSISHTSKACIRNIHYSDLKLWESAAWETYCLINLSSSIQFIKAISISRSICKWIVRDCANPNTVTSKPGDEMILSWWFWIYTRNHDSIYRWRVSMFKHNHIETEVVMVATEIQIVISHSRATYSIQRNQTIWFYEIMTIFSLK